MASEICNFSPKFGNLQQNSSKIRFFLSSADSDEIRDEIDQKLAKCERIERNVRKFLKKIKTVTKFYKNVKKFICIILETTPTIA